MGRQRTGLFEDMLDLASLLPWWVDCIIAAVSYLVLHQLSLNEVTIAPTPGQVGEMVGQTLGITLAKIGQYLIPAVFLAGAAISAFKRRKRKELLSRASSAPFEKVRTELSWREFEMLVGEHYRHLGYRVEERGGNGADGGIDLVLRREQETVLVQCKHWKTRAVGIKIVRELFGVLTAEGASRAVLITSGQVSDEAVNFCRDKRIEIITGADFDALIESGKPPTSRDSRPSKPIDPPKKDLGCPVCGSSMVRRQAGSGPRKGEYFFGCSRFPKCRGTRPL